MKLKIVSGGQTGVDRAALDAAQAHDVPIGGWCPRGRRAEDGVIDERYPLQETPSDAYAQRTVWNVRDSDGTLVLTVGDPSGGTALTIREAEQRGKPVLVLDFEAPPEVGNVLSWIDRHGIQVLNVAGPRASEADRVYERTRGFVDAVLQAASSGY